MSNYDDYCKVCKQALSKLTRDGRVTWLHRGEHEPDHAPDPAPLAEVPDAQMFCDFCSTPNPTWFYDCEAPILVQREQSPRIVGEGQHTGRYDKRLREVSTREARRWGTSGTDGVTTNAGETWSACNDCASYIDADDMYGLISRVVAAMPAKRSAGKKLAPLRGELAGFYTGFFATKQSKVEIGGGQRG